MTINEFIKQTRKIVYGEIEERRPRVVCADGYSISVQVGSGMYCIPRKYGVEHYDLVELGYPSAEDSMINDYAEEPYDLCNTVYAYVPVELVDGLMRKHGGIVNFDCEEET